MQTLAMFFAEVAVGIFFFTKEKLSPSLEYRKNHQNALREVNYFIQGKIGKYQYLYLSIPALCDFISTGLQFIGLLLVPASVWQVIYI